MLRTGLEFNALTIIAVDFSSEFKDSCGLRSSWGCVGTAREMSFAGLVERHDSGMDSSDGAVPRDSDPRERETLERELLAAIRSRRGKLVGLLEKASGHWGYEDPVYRLYHQSFKVFSLQEMTCAIVAELQDLLPARGLNPWFLQIVGEGTGHHFDLSCNRDWLRHTRPIVEAFFHARFMLEMAVRYAELESPPQTLPSGWAALLYQYGLR